MKVDLVHVEWKDHCMRGSWADDVDDFHKPSHVQTVGWIVKEDDEGITVAQSINGGDYNPSDEPGNLIYILKSCITKRRALNV